MRRENGGMLEYEDMFESIDTFATLARTMFGDWISTGLYLIPRDSPRDRELNTDARSATEVGRSSFVRFSWSHYFVEKNGNVEVRIDHQQVRRKGFVKVRIFGVGVAKFIVV